MFFQSDSLRFNIGLLTFSGFWPPDTKNKSVKVLYSLYSFVWFFSLTHIFFMQILDLYLVRNDLKNVTTNLCATSATFMCVFKQFVIFSRIEKLKRLYEKLKRFKRSRTDSREVEILKKADRLMSLTTKFIFTLGVPCISTWMLFPVIDSGKRKLPLPYRMPTEDLSTPVYEIVYTYHAFTMLGSMLWILANDMVYYGMATRINAEYEILFYRLEGLKRMVCRTGGEGEGEGRDTVRDSSITEEAKLCVRDCSAFHQGILNEIEELKVIYNYPYLLHFTACTLLVGSIIMDSIVVSKALTMQLMQRLIYSAVGAFDTFLCCLVTTNMEEKNHELTRAVYSTPWYKLNPDVRKDLLLISVRSKRPSLVRVGKTIPLNLETFLQFLRLCYNVTAILYQTMDM